MPPIKQIGIIALILIIAFTVFIGYTVFSSSSSTETETPIENPKKPDEPLGFFTQQIIFHYQDGTKSTDTFAWLYHNNKILENVEYELYAHPSEDDGRLEMVMTFYTLEYNLINDQGDTVKTERIQFSGLYNQEITKKTLLCSETWDPFVFVNYTFPDGEYHIQLIPSGEIQVDGKQTNLPENIQFQVTVKDERAIDVGFN